MRRATSLFSIFVPLVLLAACASEPSTVAAPVVFPTRAQPPAFPTFAPVAPLPTSPLAIAVLQCSDTLSQAGHNVTCTIPVASCSYQPKTLGKPTFCNDAPYPRHSFTLLVWGQDWSDYNGRCLIVTGLVSIYAGKAQIEARSRTQIADCP